MVFRRGATSTKVRPTISSTESSIPNSNLSSSPTQPLLVSLGDDDDGSGGGDNDDLDRNDKEATGCSKEDPTAMMEEGNTHNEALVSSDNLESSPYLRADTFEPSEDELTKLKRSQQRWNLIIFSVGSAAFLFAFASIILEMSTFIVFAFAFPLVLGPYMIRQRRIMNRFPALRRLINRLRFQTNRRCTSPHRHPLLYDPGPP